MPPFCKECYCSHLLCLHPNKWSKYKPLWYEDEKVYFVSNLSGTDPTQTYLHIYFNVNLTSETFEINFDVMDILIANTLFDSNKEDLTIKCFVTLFTLRMVTKDDENFIEAYSVLAKSLLQFSLSLDMLGLSFCQCTCIFQANKATYQSCFSWKYQQ